MINPEKLRNWVTQAEIDGGSRAATTTTEAERLRELEREVKELRRANAILRSASAFFAAELDPPQPLIIDYVDQHKNQFGVEPICAGSPAPTSRSPQALRQQDTSTLAAFTARRGAEGRDQASTQGELRRLRRPQAPPSSAAKA